MAMRTIGAYDAKTHLPRLLSDVAAGDRIAITRHGVPVAMLVPAESMPHSDSGMVIAALLRARRGTTLGGPVRAMIEEGRA